jgi:DNA replication protein DnaC
MVDKLREQLRRLRLYTMAEIFEEEAERAARTQLSYTAFLSRLVQEETAVKVDRSINARIAKARFPAIKTLEEFDFSFQPAIPVSRVKELGELGARPA